MEIQINAVKIIDALLKKTWLIIAAGIIAAVLSVFLVDDSAPNVYSSSCSLYSASSESYRDSVEGMNIMRDYVEIINSRKVAERASSYLMKEVSAEEIMSAISANYSINSKIITITAVSKDPARAILIANAAADAFIQETINITAAESVRVLDSAYRARVMTDMRREALKFRLIVTAAVVAALVLYIALFAFFDGRVAQIQDVTLDGKLKLLGVIPDRGI